MNGLTKNMRNRFETAMLNEEHTKIKSAILKTYEEFTIILLQDMGYEEVSYQL